MDRSKLRELINKIYSSMTSKRLFQKLPISYHRSNDLQIYFAYFNKKSTIDLQSSGECEIT